MGWQKCSGIRRSYLVGSLHIIEAVMTPTY